MELTEKEFKDLVMAVAIKIAPIIITEKKQDSVISGNTIALYANDIAEAVNNILKDPSGYSL